MMRRYPQHGHELFRKTSCLLTCLAVQSLLSTCTRMNRFEQSDAFLPNLLRTRGGILKRVLENADKHRLQLLYTQIDRDEGNKPQFRSYAYRVNTEHYFYPASTVKLPAAILSLEKLNRLNIPQLTKYTKLRIDSAFVNQTRVVHDSSALNGFASVAHYIKKIFLVSDNDAFNRLFEFLGQKYLNETVHAKGYAKTQIIRRLSLPSTPEDNRHTNPVTFFEGDKTIYHQPPASNPWNYKVEMVDIQQGKGFFKDGRLVKRAFDFSYSNYFPVREQQEMLRALLFPEAVDPAKRFNLTPDDMRFLYRYMSMLPRESVEPAYPDNVRYYDGYLKFFMFGDSKERIPPNIRIFNKSGQAYGYMIDNAYIVDFDNKIEFLLTAVLQVNENEIYNDDTYEYDEVGFPFLAELGRAIYEVERKRKRPRLPDLSRFDLH